MNQKMRVLVAGGSGIIGTATIAALLERGYGVRLLARHATQDARRWEGVESVDADVRDTAALAGAADGCDAVLDTIGIVKESSDITFEDMNVRSTEYLLRESERAGMRRFVFVSSLGADRGTSDYHKSKLAAEELVRGFRGNWTIARVANVFGPGDEVISVLLRMVRSLPAVPMVGRGDQRFQPVWHEDVGEALCRLIERDDLAGQTLEVAGGEQTSMKELLDQFAAITNRNPLRVPVPAGIAKLGAQVASAAGVELPISENHIQMLLEHNVVTAATGNALESVLGMTPTPLAEALRKLADAALEQLPEEGVGPLTRKCFSARVAGSKYSPEQLRQLVCERFAEVGPAETGVEPGTPTALVVGATLTLHIPWRGNVQVRCEEITNTTVTLASLKGHPIAGVIRFAFRQVDQEIDCEIEIHARAANVVDQVAMKVAGDRIQDDAWKETIGRIVALSGGTATEGVEVDAREVTPTREGTLNRVLRDVVARRQRHGAS